MLECQGSNLEIKATLAHCNYYEKWADKNNSPKTNYSADSTNHTTIYQKHGM
jgi:hypothetical protein